MRIVQTFWSGGKDPLTDSFGWLTPQHHFMSWAFSCLELKKNYEEVILYTDSIGYAIFAERLMLPYSEIIIQYDNINCHPTHWAYAKLLTYSLQETPFIHVDGDVYLPKRLKPEIESAGLIAQNWEISSPLCYGDMINRIREKTSTVLPPFLNNAIFPNAIPSYNAGVIGGNDLKFIKEYCDQAFQFIEKNHLKDPNPWENKINHNILFEQILFAALAKDKGKKVTTVLDHSIGDNKYSYAEFCDFYQYDNVDLMHIIGGHKRNHRVCELLERMLLKKYPEFYNKIITLFKNNHKRMNPHYVPDNSLQDYLTFIEEISQKWDNISNTELLELEKMSTQYFKFIRDKERKKLKYKLKANPHLEIYENSQKWSNEMKTIIKSKINNDFKAEHFDIACIPSLLNKGYKEILIDDLAYNTLVFLEEELSFEALLDKLDSFIDNNQNKSTDSAINQTIEYLLYHKLIFVTDKNV